MKMGEKTDPTRSGISGLPIQDFPREPFLVLPCSRPLKSVLFSVLYLAPTFALLSSGLERSFRDVRNACQSRCVMGNGGEVFPSATTLGIWKEATGLRQLGTNKMYLDICQRNVNLS